MPIEHCAQILHQALAGHILVAHAAWIEQPLIDRALATLGSRFHGHIIDTAALARAAGIASPVTGVDPGLEWLSTRLGLPVHTPHHALGDAMTTAQVMIGLATRLERTATIGTATNLITISARGRDDISTPAHSKFRCQRTSPERGRPAAGPGRANPPGRVRFFRLRWRAW